MPTLKPTQASILRRQHQISELKAKIERISAIESGRESSFWKMLKEMLTEAIKKHEHGMVLIMDQDDIASDLAHSALKKLHGLRTGAQAVVDLVEHTDEVRAQYVAQIKTLEDQIRDAQDLGVLEPQGD